MPSAVLSWLLAHAKVLLVGTVVLTVAGDQLWRCVRGDADRRATRTSLVAVAAFALGKETIERLVWLGVALVAYEHRLVDLDWRNPAVWLGLLLVRDLVYYWVHRAEHRMRLLWASHQVHHSIESFTFTNAVRLPWTEVLYKPAIALWAPLLGLHPVGYAAMGAVILIAGQWQHTEWRTRRTILDEVLMTPSNHRVHHGSNARYLDCNFGSLLVVWDRIFGTYVPETEPVRYGLTTQDGHVSTAYVLTGGYPRLLADVRAERGLRGKLRHLVTAGA